MDSYWIQSEIDQRRREMKKLRRGWKVWKYSQMKGTVRILLMCQRELQELQQQIDGLARANSIGAKELAAARKELARMKEIPEAELVFSHGIFGRLVDLE